MAEVQQEEAISEELNTALLGLRNYAFWRQAAVIHRGNWVILMLSHPSRSNPEGKSMCIASFQTMSAGDGFARLSLARPVIAEPLHDMSCLRSHGPHRTVDAEEEEDVSNPTVP